MCSNVESIFLTERLSLMALVISSNEFNLKLQKLSRLTDDFEAIDYVFILSEYSLVLVSIFNISSMFINNGTFSSAPVSNFAGLVVFEDAVSPLNPGSVYSTLSSTKSGKSQDNTWLFSTLNNISTF